jgi:glucokinase
MQLWVVRSCGVFGFGREVGTRRDLDGSFWKMGGCRGRIAYRLWLRSTNGWSPFLLIAGDIGGTKTLLAIYDLGERAGTPVEQKEYRTADYTTLDAMVREFLATSRLAVRAACFDVAGPVIDGRVHLTNLPWTIDAAALRAELALEEVFLLNDLQATAYAAPRLRAEELHTINVGERDPTGSIAVIAPGTGLGEAFLVWSNGGYVACSSEGGHASFAPTDRHQAALWHYLSCKFGHVSVERVCSGLGIANIYDFLRDADPASETVPFAAQLARETDRTPLIVRAGLTDPVNNSLATAALDLFVTALADEAGNLALKVLSTGGVYLAGGIPRRVLPKLTDGRFMQAFVKKGRFEKMLDTLPVHVVLTDAALLGAAQYGLDRLAERPFDGRSNSVRDDHGDMA